MFRIHPWLRFVEGTGDGDGGGGGAAAGGDAAGGKPASGQPGPQDRGGGEGGDSRGDGLGEGGKKALQAERKARSAAEKQADELQKRLDAIEADKLSDTEKLQKAAQDANARADAAEAKAQAAELAGLRRDVADAKKLPPAAAGRLQGSTREELEADADELAKVLDVASGPRDTPDPFTGFRSSSKTSGREAGLAEAARRFGEKT